MKVRIIKCKGVGSQYIYKVQANESRWFFFDRWWTVGSAYSVQEAKTLLQRHAGSLAKRAQIVYKGFIWDDGTLNEDMSDHV